MVETDGTNDQEDTSHKGGLNAHSEANVVPSCDVQTPYTKNNGTSSSKNQKYAIEAAVIVAADAIIISLWLYWTPIWSFLDQHNGAVGAVAALVIMLLTAAYVIISGHQWKVMGGQLKEMENQVAEMKTAREQTIAQMISSGIQTDKLIEHASSQSNALLVAAEASLTHARAATVTAEATLKAADAAKVNSDATWMSAQALVSAQRAWISAELRRYTEEAFILSIRNYGRTPGEITLVKHLEQWATSLSEFEPRSDYEKTAEQVYRKVIAPGEVWEPGGFWATSLREVLPDDIYTDVKASKKRYFIYGVVEYKDMVGGGLHETRFCFWYNPRFDVFEIGGPRDMTKST